MDETSECQKFRGGPYLLQFKKKHFQRTGNKTISSCGFQSSGIFLTTSFCNSFLQEFAAVCGLGIMSAAAAEEEGGPPPPPPPSAAGSFQAALENYDVMEGNGVVGGAEVWRFPALKKARYKKICFKHLWDFWPFVWKFSILSNIFWNFLNCRKHLTNWTNKANRSRGKYCCHLTL